MTRALIDLDALPELFPHRVARATELVRLGLTTRSIQDNCQPGGPWQRIAPGVILLGPGPPTRTQLVTSALRHAGPGAIVTGWDALHAHGMSTPAGPGDVHLLVPHNRQLRNPPRVLVERTTRLPEPLLCKGFPVAPLLRATVDTARRLSAAPAVRALVAEVVNRGRVAPAELRRELDAGSSRGAALPRQILAEVSAGVASVAEAWARRLIHRCGLPRPRWNVPIRAPDGVLLTIADAWWDDVAMVWDLDAYQFRQPPDAYAESRRRAARLTAAGIIVVHTAAGDLRDDPAQVAAELRQARLHALRRPRPPVVAPGGDVDV
jgi:hypothetical protein